MSSDRSRRPGPGDGRSKGSSKRPGSSGPGRGGKPSGRPGPSRGGRPSGKPGNRTGRPGGKPGRSSSPGRDGRRDGGRDGRRDDRYSQRPEPRTEAERRAAEVRETRGPRRTERTPEREREQIESRTTEEWIDEGSVRSEAAAATRRAGGGRDRLPTEIDPEVVAEIEAALSPDRAKRLTERLASASAALDRERFEEAKRIVTPLTRELPHVAAVHEVSGLASYRLGRWKQAAQSLELARQLHADPSLLPVLADCYRAQRRWHDVDAVWDEIKSTSPPHDVMAEGRIVVANALAERGDLKDAISMMTSVSQKPKRVRDHHLRQWYVLADLYDRAGDTLAATRWFTEIARNDPNFADVAERLRALGR